MTKFHFAIVLPPGHGHYNAGGTLGGALRKRGHKVTLIAPPNGEKYAEREDLEFWPLWPDQHEYYEERQRKLGVLTGAEAYKLTTDLLKESARLLFRDLPRALDETKADVVLFDEILFMPAKSVCEAKKLPFGSLACALMYAWSIDTPPFLTTWQYSESWLAKTRDFFAWKFITNFSTFATPIINEYREKEGLPLIGPLTPRSGGRIQLGQQPAFFEFPKDISILPKNFFYSAPWHNLDRDTDTNFPFDKINPNKKLVYASLGTVQNKLAEVYRNICRACKELDDVQLVMAMGKPKSSNDTTDIEIKDEDRPADCIIVDYAPQLQLVHKASMVITHCGMNTCMETLGCGVPALAMPITNDQPGVAARWAWLGAAFLISSPTKATPQSIRDAVKAILPEDSPYRVTAQKLKDELENNAPTVHQVAELVEMAFEGEEPLNRDDPKIREFLKGTQVDPEQQVESLYKPYKWVA